MSRSPAPVNPVSMAAVAARAGVSVATVSRVLNHQEGVTDKTQAKVNRAVHELGYRVNQLANSLRTARSWLLLIMVPDLGNPFYIEIVRGIDRVARQHGYFVLLCDTGADPGRERSAFELLRTHRADGAICLDPDSIQQGLSQEINALPWVACCEFDPAMPVPYVGIDNQGAAAEAIRYLLSRGHSRIALIGADPAYLYARASGRPGSARPWQKPASRWRMSGISGSPASASWPGPRRRSNCSTARSARPPSSPSPMRWP